MAWQPGESGNPGGRRDEKTWRDAIRKELAAAELEDRPHTARKLARMLLEKAAAGDVSALKELGDRLDGKPAQAVELSGDPDKPVAINVTSVDTKL